MLGKLINQSQMRQSILKAIRTYQGSNVQSRYHQFDPNPSKVQSIKSTIDYETVNKQSQGCLMIREFLFQQSKPQIQINFRSKYLVPIGKWTNDELEKFLEEEGQEVKTPTELQNELIMKEMNEILKEKLNKYYENLGKQNYTFSVKEQVVKISQMRPKDFDKLMDSLELGQKQ